MKLERFEDLEAWQEARVLVNLTYRVTKDSAFGQDRDLVRQMRRAASSVMANLAEGFSRYSFKDSKQFYMTARSSLSELRSHSYVASDQQYLGAKEQDVLMRQMEVVGKLMSGLIRNSQRRLDLIATNVGTIERLNH